MFNAHGNLGLAVATLLAVVSGLSARSAWSQPVTLYDSGGFQAFTTGPLGGAGQGGWSGSGLNGGTVPEIADVGGSRALRLSVPDWQAGQDRRESRIVKTFATPIDIASYETLIVECDVTTDADGNGVRHNLYFDFDPIPNKFLPNAQMLQDNGTLRLVRNGVTVCCVGNGAYHVRWVFNVAPDTLKSFFGPWMIDSQTAVRLQDVIASQATEDPDGNPGTLDALSFALVSDNYQGPADAMLLDNVVVRGVRAEPFTGWTEVDPEGKWYFQNAKPTVGRMFETGSSSTTGPGWIVSDFLLSGTASFSISIKVDEDFDDDFFGIAFGYQDNTHFYLLDWRQAQNTEDWGDAGSDHVAEEGIKLKKVNGWSKNGLWGGTGGGVTTLAEITGSTAGWENFRLYVFDFRLTPGHIEIRRDGVPLFSISDNSYCGGRIALYGMSQRGLVFSNLAISSPGPRTAEISSRSPAAAFPATGTLPDQIATLNGGPPPYDMGTWQPVQRHAGNHIRSAFGCSVPLGTIVGQFGNIQVLTNPPPSVAFDAYESNSFIRVFAERSGHLLSQSVELTVSEPGSYDELGELPPIGNRPVIPGGTRVTSHLLHFDTMGNTDVFAYCSITFDTEILGVCATDSALIHSDQELGVQGFPLDAYYPRNAGDSYKRQMEFDPPVDDAIAISADRKTLTIIAHVAGWNDQVRVVTRGDVPDPLSRPFVDAGQFIHDADEVTLNNCGSAFYRWTFSLPPHENPRLYGVVNADDVAVAYLNGVAITPLLLLSDTFGTDRLGACGPLVSAPTRDYFGTGDGGLFRVGENELVFAVCGDASASEPTGVEFTAMVEFEETDVVGVGEPIAREVPAPEMPWPNPTRGGASLSFSLPWSQQVSLTVHDVAGRLVRTLTDGPLGAGPHLVHWDGRDRDHRAVGSGVYFVRMQVEGRSFTRRIAVVR